MTKKITKVIIYYEDGTYQEVENSVLGLPSKEDKKPASPSPVIPDFRPDTQQLRDWQQQPPWAPPFTVTCTTGNVPLKYTITPDAEDMLSWSFTSTGNSDNLNKYTITSTGNGNVDLSK